MDFTNLWSSIDMAIVIVYFAVVLGIGFYLRRRASKNMKSFFVASRRLTIPIMICVAVAGWYDSWSIIGVAECGALYGVSIIFVYVIPGVILRLPLAIWIGPLVRNKIPDWVVTFPDLFEYLYDRKTKLVQACAFLPVVLYESAPLLAAGQVLHMVTGLNIWLLLCLTAAVIILYTSLSGMFGLAVTDMVQFLIMGVATGAVILGIYSYFDGFGNLFDQIEAYNPNFLTLKGEMSGAEMFSWIISAVAMYANAQCYQRFGASKTGGDVAVSYTLMMCFGGIFSITWVFAGMAALIAFPEATSTSEQFWAMIFTVLPVGMRGLFVAAIIAAVMSTASADMLLAASILMTNIIKDFLKPDMTERQNVVGTKIALWVIGGFIVLGTIFFQDGISKAYYYIGGFQASVFMIPLLVGLYYKKKTPAAGFWTLIICVVLYISWEFILGAPFGLPSNVVTMVTSFVLFMIISKLTYKGDEDKSLESNSIQ